MSDSIFDDMLLMILKYLPLKTLMQFRCVCKGWKQLIDSPAFVRRHVSIQNPTFIIQHGRGRNYFVLDPLNLPLHSVKSLNKPTRRGQFHLFGTHHGIVCLFDMKKLLLWNPSIRRISTIHLPDDLNRLEGCFKCGGSRICYGFWIHPFTKEFKIIVVQTRPEVNCFLYSNTVCNWSLVPNLCKLENWTRLKDGPAVIIGDVAYWVGCLDESVSLHPYNRDHGDDIILSFSFIKESFEVIELPNPDMMGYYNAMNASAFSWKDTLSVVFCSDQFPSSSRCKIFLRTEDSWTAVFDFEVQSNFQQVFWAMEDSEEVKKREGQDNVRVLATTVSDPKSLTNALVLNGTNSGCKPAREGLERYIDVIMAHGFVESLLFPSQL